MAKSIGKAVKWKKLTATQKNLHSFALRMTRLIKNSMMNMELKRDLETRMEQAF